MEPKPREVHDKMPSLMDDLRLSCALFSLAVVAFGFLGLSWFNGMIPLHSWFLPTVPFLFVFGYGAWAAHRDYKLYYSIISDDLKLEYDAKVVEDAMNKVEGVEFRELVRDPAVLRQLLSAFDNIEVGIENVTVKYRGKDIKLRACRLWRDGDKLRISR